LKKIPEMIKFFRYISLIATALMLMSWGNTGHRIISGKAALSFNAEMEDFQMWVDALIEHASDADIRKQWDPDEGPRHYIDIDLYDEFQLFGTIPQNIEDAIAQHGYSFVYDAGVLPWATLKTYDSLVACFQRLDWDRAVLYAADLGHYVADGHMPLHITANYDGQYTGNYGIHSRYESSMVNTYQGQILYEGFEIEPIPDVRQYIFDYLYSNYAYVDSVLAADDYAKSVNSNTSSSEYKQALWQETGGFTVMLFEKASHSLAELIYSAWAEAGKPKLFTGPFIFTHNPDVPELLDQNIPNPFSSSTDISFTLPRNANVKLEIRDIRGNIVETLVDTGLERGEHRLRWNAGDQPVGTYFIILKSGGITEARKMILLR
jgi:hypothetical protein